MSEKTAHRFLELDVLRGIAAFSVVLFHYTSQYATQFQHSPQLHFYFAYGRHGVELFFIISGFVILMSVEKTKRSLDFLVGRFSRLYPAYWVAVILTFLVSTIAKLPLPEVSIFDALLNLTMIHGFFSIPNIDDVYWTLKVELCFYLLMFTIYRAGQLKNINLIAIGWFTLTLFYAFKTYTARWGLFTEFFPNFNIFTAKLYNFTIFTEHNQIILMGATDIHQGFGTKIKDFLQELLIFKYAHLFILGMTLYKAGQNGFSRLRWMMIVACILAQRVAYSWENSWETTIFVAACVLIFYIAMQGYIKFIKIKPLIFLGTISYSLYLTHQNIGYAIIRALYNYKINPNISILIAILFSISLATLISKFIEYPAMAYIRDKYKNKILPKLS